MVSFNASDESSNEYYKYEEATALYYQQRVRLYCMNYDLEHQEKLQKDIENVLHKQKEVIQTLTSFISQLSADIILKLIKDIYEYKMKLDEIEKIANIIQKKLRDLINHKQEDFKIELNTMINGSEDDLRNIVKRLSKQIEEQKLKLEEIDDISNNTEQLPDQDKNLRMDKGSETKKSVFLNIGLPNKKTDLNTSENNEIHQLDETIVLPYLRVKQISPTIIDFNEIEDNEINTDSEEKEIEKNEMNRPIDFNKRPSIHGKVRLSNNIVAVLRGPLKVMAEGSLHMVDVFAKATHINQGVFHAVQQGLERQKKISIEQQTTKDSLRQPFVEITSEWKYEGENSDKGFNSPSIWMHDPQGQRVLFKIQDLPICAANEWLVYAIGMQLGLPVNIAQIGIYENNLVTSHTDIAQKDEKTITFMDLPRRMRKKLLTDPILENMDLFDHIIQNVDRNPRNILITIPKTSNIEDENVQMKIHLIDHALSFGMGKFSGLSIMAAKFHTKHLSVGKFDPIDKTNKFEQYLNKLPTSDRMLIGETLNRFAAITDKQIDTWITEIQDLLTPGQYNRIHSVLYRQRDLVKRYTIQWGIHSKSSSLELKQTNRSSSDTNDMVTVF